MLGLAWANLTHHKVRTLLSALAVGLGIALLLISKGLAGGSIAEVARRVQSVDAELVVLPAQENLIFTNGAPFRAVHERHLARQSDGAGLAEALSAGGFLMEIGWQGAFQPLLVFQEFEAG